MKQSEPSEKIPPQLLPSGVKLVAIDLDGTLLDGHKELPENAVEVFSAAHRAGLLVSIVTGRNATSVLELSKILNLSGPHASSGGAFICGKNGHPVYASHPLNLSEAQKIVEISRRWNLTIFLHNSKRILMENGERFLALGPRPHYPAQPEPTNDILVDLNFKPLKATIYGERDDLENALVDFKKCQGCFDLTTAGEEDIEITAFGVNKGSALREISSITGIPLKNTMAIGDSPNDVSMFKEVGVAVAVANASLEAKQVAKIIAPSNNEAGVLWAIQNLALSLKPIE
jgi:Cof subfamily protein (haloacid dehalogenase superfamily)